MYCNKCGNKLEDGMKYCNKCGNKIKNVSSEIVNSEFNKKIKKKKSYKIIPIVIGIIILVLLSAVSIYAKISKFVARSNVTNNENSQQIISKSITENKLTKLNYDVQINKDSSMQVVETWNINILDANTLFKTFVIDNKKYKDITNVKVYEILNNGDKKEFSKIDKEMEHVTKDSYYGLVNSDKKFEIAWGISTKNEVKTYQISYKVNDVVKVYDDRAELYWCFLGNQFNIPIDNITGTIKVENVDKTEGIINFWAHTKDGSKITNKNDNIVFSGSKYKKGDMFEIRLLFPSKWFNQKNKINKEIAYQVELEEYNYVCKNYKNIKNALINYYKQQADLYNNEILSSEEYEKMEKKLAEEKLKEYDRILGVEDENAECSEGTIEPSYALRREIYTKSI